MRKLRQQTGNWLTLSLVLGSALGILLLVQSVANYRFVSGRLMQEAAEREAGRKYGDVLRALRASETSSLQDVLESVKRESPEQIAWIRVSAFDGRLLAVTGDPGHESLPSPSRVARLANRHEASVRLAGSGRSRTLIAASRLRLPLVPTPRPAATNEPPAAGRPGESGIIEIAILFNGVSISFTRLETNLVVGCLAALALLASNAWIAVLLRRHLRARELDRQLELARDVQHDLLPSPDNNRLADAKLEFAALFVPAAELGGDFYDVFDAGDQHLGLVIGDVSGKGVSAALLVGIIHGAVRSSAWARSVSGHETATHRLNMLLAEKSDSARFATLFWACFEPVASTLRYVNAGHLPPLLVRTGRPGAPIESLSDGGGPVLGLLPHASYTSHEIVIEPGDLLVMYSDGITEAMNAHEEEFGAERLIALVRQHANLSPGEICRAIRTSVAEFLGRLKPHDDQTLVIARLAPVPAAEILPQVRQAVPERPSPSPVDR